MLYWAIFEQENNYYNVSFPDLDGAFTFGEDLEESLHMAKDLLEGWLITAEENKETFPKPSDHQEIQVPHNAFLVPIEANLKVAKERYEQEKVKKTLTIPRYLNTLAEENNINFSSVLTKALQETLEK